MSMYTSKNPAGSAALELGLLTVGLGTLMADAHANGMLKVDEARARRKKYDYNCALFAARVRADDLGREAIASARRVAALEAEVRSLRVALQQRQGIIDRLTGRARAA
ncbi:hypothetical protein ASF70_12670 [Rhizobium sp. Leaf321]|uniref:hypothetical protein n=1 Tax=Rhizobium sp. Leaf321 TaxID=1736335 RepID=UPI000715C833|nr:hypothetical protein [Rhizobium sp. Leaf321]KQQ72381.1 hypothetical protein ASF70_12670 [Rhizobium sp. Leaf321]